VLLINDQKTVKHEAWNVGGSELVANLFIMQPTLRPAGNTTPAALSVKHENNIIIFIKASHGTGSRQISFTYTQSFPGQFSSDLGYCGSQYFI